MTRDLEHPEITKARLTGYPNGFSKFYVNGSSKLIDIFGTEIESGEEYYLIDYEVLAQDNVHQFLVQELGAKIKVKE